MFLSAKIQPMFQAVIRGDLS